jgi:nucleoside-diphosphate-sugar epimerase
MKYIVTGGAGFIGSHISEYIAQDGHEVIIFDNLFSGKEENIEHLFKMPNLSFIKGTITDLNTLMDVFKDADGIFHQAAIASVPRSIKDPLATNEANITGTLNVLIAARETGVKKVVYASSSSVYGDTPVIPKTEDMIPIPKSPYAVSKLTGEYYCKVFSEIYGLKTVSLRYFNIFGPRQDPNSEYAAVIPKFITRVLNKEAPIIYGDGKQTRDFTYVKDTVQANVKAMESNAEGVFNVACNQRINLLELAEIIMNEIGHQVKPLFDSPRAGDVRDSLADISAAKNAFGYSPEYAVVKGLRETIAWYRAV